MDEIKDFDYIKKYFQIKNDKYIDFGKWVYALYKFEYKLGFDIRKKFLYLE